MNFLIFHFFILLLKTKLIQILINIFLFYIIIVIKLTFENNLGHLDRYKFWFLLWFLLTKRNSKSTFEIAGALIRWQIFISFLIQNQNGAYFFITLKVTLIFNKFLSLLLIWKWNSALMLWILNLNSFVLYIFVYGRSCNWIIFILKIFLTFGSFMKIVIVMQMKIWWRNFIIKAFFRFWISMWLWISLACLRFRNS